MGGDTTALRICLERLVPPVRIKDEPVIVKGLDKATSLVEQGQAVINALATGEVSPSEGATLMSSVANQARIIEIDEIEKRLAALEENTNEG